MSLPDKHLVSIFSCLGLEDLNNCRLVSRRWKHFANQRKIKELIIDLESRNAQKLNKTLDSNWYNTEDAIKAGNRIDLNFNRKSGNRFKLVRMQLVMPMFVGLRRIRLICLQRIDDDSARESQALFDFVLNNLFTFRQLEQLELVIANDVLVGEHWKFQHPTLRALYVDYARVKVNHHFTIDCPKLYALCWLGHFAKVKVNDPHSIRVLEGDFPHNNEQPLDLSLYTSLESFRFCGFPNDLSADFFVSNNSPLFSEFRWNNVTLEILDQDSQDLEHFIVIVNRLFADQKRLKRENFKVFLAGEQLDSDLFAHKIELHKKQPALTSR